MSARQEPQPHQNDGQTDVEDQRPIDKSTAKGSWTWPWFLAIGLGVIGVVMVILWACVLRKSSKVSDVPGVPAGDVVVRQLQVLPGLSSVEAARQQLIVGRDRSPDAKAAILVCGNSGKVGGGTTNDDGQIRWRSIHANYHTQEEDVVSSWMTTESDNQRNREAGNMAFQDGVALRYGMRNLGRSPDLETIQHIDYTTLRTQRGHDLGAGHYLGAEAFATPAAVVENANLSPKVGGRYDIDNSFQADLVFVAGPNAWATGEPRPRPAADFPYHGASTLRTLCYPCIGNDPAAPGATDDDRRAFALFKNGIKAALKAGLQRMIDQGVTVAVLGGVSTGIYAGPDGVRTWEKHDRIPHDEHPYNNIVGRVTNQWRRERMEARGGEEYVALVNEVLAEEYRGMPIGNHFTDGVFWGRTGRR